MLLEIGFSLEEVEVLLFSKLRMSGIELRLVLIGRQGTLSGALASFAQLDHYVYNRPR